MCILLTNRKSKLSYNSSLSLFFIPTVMNVLHAGNSQHHALKSAFKFPEKGSLRAVGHGTNMHS